jgi:FkbM family methyltransferase
VFAVLPARDKKQPLNDLMDQIKRRLRGLLWRSVSIAPLKYRLPLRVRLMRHKLYPAEPEWLSLASLGSNRGAALDIGANCGYYSYALAALYDRVIAFEPNPSVTKELEACHLPQVEIRHLGLSDSVRKETLYVPRSKDGRLLTGWASFDRNHLQERIGEIEVSVQTARLDSFELSGVSFVKIDVEGHEVAALRGAEKFLQTNRPTVLIEVRPETLDEVTSLLTRAGLEEVSIPGGEQEEAFSAMRLFAPSPPRAAS